MKMTDVKKNLYLNFSGASAKDVCAIAKESRDHIGEIRLAAKEVHQKIMEIAITGGFELMIGDEFPPYVKHALYYLYKARNYKVISTHEGLKINWDLDETEEEK